MSDIVRPTYSRRDLSVGIVHVGVGNFHRSHQAMFLDRLFTAGLARDWGICGIGVLPSDARMRDALLAQDLAYTLVERSPDGTARARTIHALAEYLFAPDDPDAVVERLADPAVRIVSLTITEGGYNIDEATGEFDTTAPAIAADLAEDATPTTVFGLVAEGLRRRRDRGIPAFTVMSCDNLQGNGHVARRSFVAYARAKDSELGEWISHNVAFPSSMVDRITPVTGADEHRFVRDEFGIDDAWPVVSEDFVQWVLEDDFAAGRPPLDLAGVQLVEDVMPYERMKLRLLNASHQALAYLGLLNGHRFAHEAATDPAIDDFVRRFMREEAEPTLGTVPGIDLAVYERSLMERFANAHVGDTLVRLATDASDRISAFVLPVARDRIAAGQPVDLAAAIVAAWAVYVRRMGEHGIAPALDRQAAIVSAAITAAADDPAILASSETLFGDLASSDRFVDAFVRAHRTIHDHGVRGLLTVMDTAPGRQE